MLDWFGETPDPIPTLYAQLRAEGSKTASDGLYDHSLVSYFQRRDWVAFTARSGGPVEYDNDGKQLGAHDKDEQRVATWRNIKRMIQDGYLCILSYRTLAKTYHFAVIYDAYVKKDIHWLRIACSSQGYMELQAISFLDKTGMDMVFVKPDNMELR